jgi:hypothetical protein
MSIKRELFTTVDGWVAIGLMVFVVSCIVFAIIRFSR